MPTTFQNKLNDLQKQLDQINDAINRTPVGQDCTPLIEQRNDFMRRINSLSLLTR